MSLNNPVQPDGESCTAPWVIGEPPPAIISLVRSGWIRGSVDSALFHIFDVGDRDSYVRSLYRVCRPDALVHVLALSYTGPSFGPQVSDTVIRDAFGDGWVLEDLQASRYRGVIVASTHAALLGRPIEDLVDLPAWLARARRL